MIEIETALKSLRLSGMATTLDMRHQEAKANELDYLEFLERLLQDELQRRRDNLLKRRIHAAKFPSYKALDEFDFAFNPSIPKRQVMELASCSFVYQNRNILFLGPPGVGKSHLAMAIGLQAIHNGYTVYYRSAFDLVTDMMDAFMQDERKRLVKQLTRYNALIIDEFGMKQMPAHAADDLLEIIHRRYQQGSTIIATNRPLEDWGAILGDNAATSAILDRFLHDAILFKIKGKSYRMQRSKADDSQTGQQKKHKS